MGMVKEEIAPCQIELKRAENGQPVVDQAKSAVDPAGCSSQSKRKP
jgi:hypothetical protein